LEMMAAELGSGALEGVGCAEDCAVLRALKSNRRRARTTR